MRINNRVCFRLLGLFVALLSLPLRSQEQDVDEDWHKLIPRASIPHLKTLLSEAELRKLTNQHERVIELSWGTFRLGEQYAGFEPAGELTGRSALVFRRGRGLYDLPVASAQPRPLYAAATGHRLTGRPGWFPDIGRYYDWVDTDAQLIEIDPSTGRFRSLSQLPVHRSALTGNLFVEPWSGWNPRRAIPLATDRVAFLHQESTKSPLLPQELASKKDRYWVYGSHASRSAPISGPFEGRVAGWDMSADEAMFVIHHRPTDSRTPLTIVERRLGGERVREIELGRSTSTCAQVDLSPDEAYILVVTNLIDPPDNAGGGAVVIRRRDAEVILELSRGRGFSWHPNGRELGGRRAIRRRRPSGCVDRAGRVR